MPTQTEAPQSVRDGRAAIADGMVNVGDTVIVPPSITVTIDPTSLIPPADGGASTLLIVPSNYGQSRWLR